MFSILTLFLISMLMLVKTMNNSSSLNKKITEKVVDNINYDASGTVQDQILELKTTITSMQNQIDNIKREVINEIYPVGSIYMSTEDDTIEVKPLHSPKHPLLNEVIEEGIFMEVILLHLSKH